MSKRLRHCRAIGLSVGLVLTCACAGMQAPQPVARVSEPSPPSPLVLFVAPDPRPNEYAIVMLRGDESRIVGTQLVLYDHGKASGNVDVVERIEGSHEACVEPDRVRLDDAIVPDAGAVLGNIDINPGQRFSMRAASPMEMKALLAAAAEGGQDIAAVAAVGAGQAEAASAVVFSDSQDARREWALLTIDANGENASASTQATLLALLVRDKQSSWKRLLADGGSGCDDCESQPTSHRLRAFGDFDQDGRIDLLLESSGYENVSYNILTHSDAGDWKMEPLVGGGGC